MSGSYGSLGHPGENVLINGAMQIAQRASSGNIASGASEYTLDRWLVTSIGSSTDFSQTNGFGKLESSLQLQPQSGNTSTVLQQRVEARESINLQGETCIFFGKVYISNVGSTTLNLSLLVPDSKDIWTSFSSTSLGAVSLKEGAWADFKLPLTISDTSNGLSVTLNFTNSAEKEIRVTGLGLVAGSISTNYYNYAQELRKCQRYYSSRRLSHSSGILNVHQHSPFLRASPSYTPIGNLGTVFENSADQFTYTTTASVGLTVIFDAEL